MYALSRLLVLLDRRRLLSLSISCRSWARGVALSTLYLTGFTSVEIGGRGGCEGDCFLVLIRETEIGSMECV